MSKTPTQPHSKVKAREPIVILVGPSGAGKSTMVERAVAEMNQLVDLITYTTRAPRKGESDGNPYFFVTEEKFRRLVEQDFFIEWAQVHDNLYGSPKDQLRQAWSRGQAIIMDVDVQGALSFKEKYPQALTIFVHPPSIEALRQRLIKREGRAPKDLELRLKNAQREIAQSSKFDRQIVNDDLEGSYAQFKKLVEDHLERG